MIAVDTNLLVYAHRKDSDWHRPGKRAVKSLAEGRSVWAIPWPCIHEFLAIVTHPKIYDPPTPVERALAQVGGWMESPTLALLSEVRGYREIFERLVRRGKVAGARIHDARIAALCDLHGVSTLWTADRDFSRFPELEISNPLVDES